MANFFEGRRVLVTGGAMGLGKATVEKFYEAGAKVIVLDKNLAALQLLKGQFPLIETVQADVFDWEDTKEIVKCLRPLHHLVNNAGVISFGGILDVSPAEVERVFKINFEAQLNISQVFSQGVISSAIKDATIVNVSSVADRLACWGIYGASKAAITYLTLSSAFELGKHGIRVNAIRPGGVLSNLDTDHFAAYPELEQTFKEFTGKQIIKDELLPSHIASTIFFLSSPQSGMLTGQAIPVDGGASLY